MTTVNNYELYFATTDKDKYICDETIQRYGTLLTEDSVSKFLSGVNEYKRTYATNENDVNVSHYLKFHQIGDTDDFSIEEISSEIPINEIIVVWIGSSDYIYQDSCRIVTTRDLEILSKGLHVSDKKETKRAMNNYWRVYKGRKPHTTWNSKRHTYKSTLIKELCSYEDNSEYNINGKSRVTSRVYEILDWDKSLSRNSAGWKSTKKRYQWE